MAGVRGSASSTRVSFNKLIVGNYTEAHIMQLCRSAKQRSELKSVSFAGLDALYAHAMSELQRNNNRCDCCKGEFWRKEGKGGGADKSLSLHRVIASCGYVPSNIKIICMACNGAIGETNTYADIVARVKALRWQAKIMLREGKKLLDKLDQIG